jgi:ATP-dependent RNA helicase HelY
MKYRGFELDRFQADAFDYLKRGHSVLVSAPTGTGKTLVADLIIEERLKAGREVIYTAPVKALSNQKYRDYTAAFGEEKVGLVTGDQVIRKDAPLRIMTTEILRNMLLVGEPLEHLATVVIDEIHFLDDPERGTVWEELLIYLPTQVQILGLSATLSNLDQFADWLGSVRDAEVAVVHEDRRAVPLSINLANRHVPPCNLRHFASHHARQFGGKGGKQGRNLNRRKGRRPPKQGKREKATQHHEMIAGLEPDLLPCLYFVYSRKTCEQYSRELSRRRDGYLTEEESANVLAQLEAFEEKHPQVLQSDLAQGLLRGIAFHHAGLHVHLKGLVEGLYEQRLIHVLYCTTTFALGINMPARTVVFNDTQRYDGRGYSPLTVREFMQMAGRAGRRGIDRNGHAVVRLEFDDFRSQRPLIERFLAGEPEPVRSSFNLSFNSVVNLLGAYDEATLRDLLGRSFLSYQLAHRRKKRRGDEVWNAFLRKKALLEQIGYIANDGTPHAGGAALQHLQIEEIFATEIVLSGLLEGLEESHLFATLVSMVCDPGPSVRLPRPTGPLRKLDRELAYIRRSNPVLSAEKEQSEAATYCPEMLLIGANWYDGVSLIDILDRLDTNSDVAGILINGFRRAKDLAGQLRDVYKLAEDEVMLERLRTVIKTVSRDEVEVVG